MEEVKRVQQPQVSSTIPADLYEKIVEMAANDFRPISQMVAILLQQAVKERERQRTKSKRAKQSHT